MVCSAWLPSCLCLRVGLSEVQLERALLVAQGSSLSLLMLSVGWSRMRELVCLEGQQVWWRLEEGWAIHLSALIQS